MGMEIFLFLHFKCIPFPMMKVKGHHCQVVSHFFSLLLRENNVYNYTLPRDFRIHWESLFAQAMNPIHQWEGACTN